MPPKNRSSGTRPDSPASASEVKDEDPQISVEEVTNAEAVSSTNSSSESENKM